MFLRALELVLLVKMHSEAVVPCTAFVTHVTFVLWVRVTFMYFLVMGLDRAEGDELYL